MKTNMFDSAVLALLPSAGLCNKLYIWAKALVFAEINGLPFYCVGWTKPKVGTILRREQSTRWYLNQIRKEKKIDSSWILARYLFGKKKFDPVIARIDNHELGTVFVFRDLLANSIPDNSFKDLIGFRDLIRVSLLSLVESGCKRQITDTPFSPIAIHVRRGDFKSFDWWQPIESFTRTLQNARDLAKECLPAIVYSDGKVEELAALLEMPNVTLAPKSPDVVDLFRLSLSAVLITSRASTFSNWAAFLSEGMVIRDPLFSHMPSRPASVNEKWFEGDVSDKPDEWPALARNNLLKVAEDYRMRIIS